MSNKEISRFTAAYWRTKTDEELEDALRGGPIGNKDVDSALAEIQRRSSERQERWTKAGFWAALVAAGVALVGTAATLLD